MSKILLIEDDREVSSVVKEWLVDHDKYMLDLIENGQEAIVQLRIQTYDLLIVDWNLPGMSGVEICQTYRKNGGKSPILMLTGKSAISEKETGLDSGADDYLTKPFDLRELSARIRALLRRPISIQGNQITVGEIILDKVNFTVQREGTTIQLTPKEFELLELFMRNPGTALSPEMIMQRIWSTDSDSSPEGVRVHIKRLRDKIDTPDKPSLIKTVHRVGYRFDP